MNDNHMSIDNASDSRDDQKTTVKIPAITKANELEYLEMKYKEAMDAYLDKPSYANREAFLAANKALSEVKDQYRVAGQLLLQRNVTQLYYPSHNLQGL